MIKIAVCDDDEKNLRDTLKLLEQYKKFPLSADAYTSGEAQSLKHKSRCLPTYACRSLWSTYH